MCKQNLPAVTDVPKILLLGLLLLLPVSVWSTEKSHLPNILLIFIENIQDLPLLSSKTGSKHIENHTLPNLQRLINQSLAFKDMYSELSSSSTSASLLTGLPAVETGMIKGKILPFQEFPSLACIGGIPPELDTMANYLKKKNYITSFLGYWKLGSGENGSHLPSAKGFDIWTGVPVAHSSYCIGNNKRPSTQYTANHPYVKLMKKTSLLWISIVVGLFGAYYFKLLTFRGFVNSLVYTLCGSFVLYILYRIVRQQQLASCVLYQNNEVIEQPYQLQNMTLYLTSSVMTMMRLFTQHNLPFFLHFNYFKMRPPYFASPLFQNESAKLNSLLELDWSIGKILDTLDELNIRNETVVMVTGSNNCPHQSSEEKVKTSVGTSFRSFFRLNQEEFTSSEAVDQLDDCIKVPFYLRWSKLKDIWGHSSVIDVPVTMEDILPTVLDIVNEPFISLDLPGCSLLPLVLKNATSHQSNHPLADSVDSVEPEPEAASSTNAGRLDNDTIDHDIINKEELNIESYRNRCDLGHRYFLHYYDVRKPVAVTYGSRFRMVFATVGDDGSVYTLKTPIIIDLFNNGTKKTFGDLFLEELYQNITKTMEKRLSQRKNKWTSQFEMPIYPWLLPCSNFPRCEVSRQSLDDFSHFLSHDKQFVGENSKD